MLQLQSTCLYHIDVIYVHSNIHLRNHTKSIVCAINSRTLVVVYQCW